MSTLAPSALQTLLQFAAELDLSKPAEARRALEERFPFDGEFVQGIHQSMRAGVAAGELCDQGADPVRYSRLFKAGEDSFGLSADAVLMSAPGPLHEHPDGEIDLCFAEDGDPKFDGQAPGWVVYGPGSKHVPTVEGGTMLILYLLPNGAIRFLKG
ncbi:MAG: DUF4863 family protein [Planctomycetota bacterium]|nr:MAG: DUF4863 family protein [Planctomycetota bacterium]